MRIFKDGSTLGIPILLGFLITTSLDILIEKFGWDRGWDAVSTWVTGLSIGMFVLMLMVDVDRFLARFFQSEESYRKFCSNVFLGVAVLTFVALTVRWYVRHGSNFSM
ncbi:MAG: hypothetical protein K2Z25_19935 [Beijerinckiaceae bacterium]|nr:hypothetical protein [Beijerinckiaceae bacterium]